MVKAYLRYELASAFGVVASGANILYDDTGKIIFAACLENVAMWSVKQANMVSNYDLEKLRSAMHRAYQHALLQVRLLQTPPSASGKPAAEATQLALSTPGQPLQQLGVGHADGTVRMLPVRQCLSACFSAQAVRWTRSASARLQSHAGGCAACTRLKHDVRQLWHLVGTAGCFP